MSRGEPIELRDAVARVGRDLGIPDPAALTALVGAWPALVGPLLAQHSGVRSVRDGVGTISVDDPAWATELRYRADEIVERAREVCGTTVLSSIRVVVDTAGKSSF